MILDNNPKSLAFKIHFIRTQNPADLVSMSVRFRPPAPPKIKGLAFLVNPFFLPKSWVVPGIVPARDSSPIFKEY
jgi:hypothetical protein